MIFATVGTQLPFDRLIRALDQWAGARGRNDIFAQIGPSTFQPSHVQWKPFIAAPEFRERVTTADLVVAHAGMGSIITALELGKPILVMPRRANLQEHRNDHQVATAERFLAQGRIQVAFDEVQLLSQLDRMDDLVHQQSQTLSPTASAELLKALRDFIGQST